MREITNSIRVQIEDGPTFCFKGRNAWTLRNLLKFGANGFTVFDAPGPRLAHYVFELRRAGLNIETVDERHGGAFPGFHARYRLLSQVTVLEDSEKAAA